MISLNNRLPALSVGLRNERREGKIICGQVGKQTFAVQGYLFIVFLDFLSKNDYHGAKRF
jgi:hypothetical protein